MRVLIAWEFSWRERSRTFTGIADAMAEQWGGTLTTTTNR